MGSSSLEISDANTRRAEVLIDLMEGNEFWNFATSVWKANVMIRKMEEDGDWNITVNSTTGQGQLAKFTVGPGGEIKSSGVRDPMNYMTPPANYLDGILENILKAKAREKEMEMEARAPEGAGEKEGMGRAPEIPVVIKFPQI